MRSIILLLLFLLPSIVFAQTAIVKGTVADERGQPLIGANVVLKNTLLGAATDRAGAFTIRNVPPGGFTLRVSMIGYEAVEKRIDPAANQTLDMPFVLKESVLRTEEIVVTAGKRQQSLEDVPISISVFEAERIQERTLTRLDDALRYIPGVNMTESQINIRGSSGYSRALGSRVLVLLDGIPMLTADAGEVKYDAIPMHTIDRIEVVKGSGSALYGSSALGGVINVITKEPAEQSIHASVYTGFYDDPYYSEWKWWGNSPRYFNGATVFYGNTIDGLMHSFSAGVVNNQGYRLNDQSLRYNLSGRAAYSFTPEKKASIAVNYASDNRGNWIYWKDLANALIPPDNADRSETVQSDKFQASAQFQNTVSSSMAYSLKASFYRTLVDIASDTSDFSFRQNDRVQSAANSIFIEAQGTYAFDAKDVLVFGANYSYNDVDAIAYGKRSGYGIAVFAQNDYKFIENANLSTGIRYDISNIESGETDASASPKAGISYSPLESTAIRASFGMGFRSPSIAERYTSAAAGPIRTKPNPGLKSERSVSYEIGVKQTLPVPVILDAAFFYNDYENLVEPIYDAADGRIKFENITRARVNGFEANAMAAIIPGMLNATIGYTYLNPRDLTKDENGNERDEVLKYRPRQLLYCSGNLTYAGFNLGADFRYIARIESIDAALAVLIRNSDERVPAYVTDVRLGYDCTRLGLPFEAVLAVGNVFQYNYSEIVGNIAPVRNYMLTLNARL